MLNRFCAKVVLVVGSTSAKPCEKAAGGLFQFCINQFLRKKIGNATRAFPIFFLSMGYKKDIFYIFAYEFEPSHALSFYTAL